MLQIAADLILELVAKDRRAAASSPSWIAALDHEVGDDAVEDGAIIVIARGESREVLAGLGCVGGVELDSDGAQRRLEHNLGGHGGRRDWGTRAGAVTWRTSSADEG